jgi:hypothetical protein
MKKVMKKMLAEARHGFRQALLFSRARPYYFPPGKSFSLDTVSLRGDMEQVARDLNKQFRK